MLTRPKAILGVLVLILVIYVLFAFDVPYKNTVDDFETCVAYGNPVMESYPRQCRAKDGKLYIEKITQATSTDMIHVTFPQSEAVISSPVRISGEARGNWFFEASFPAQVIDADGTILGQGPVTALGEWMTTEFVSFDTLLDFNKPTGKTGFVRLMKDNPSGLPENDAHVDIPVSFSVSGSKPIPTAKACKPTGCSSQICSDQDIASTCEYRSEYACYQTAECKRQSNGLCGWTQTPALSACLTNN